MEFEPALENELKSISALNNRVYPFVSPKQTYDTRTPYVIYRSSYGLRTKDLDGYQSGKTVRGELNVIAPRYADMKTITSTVIDKLVDMEQREIGTGGPYVQSVEYEEPVEMYEEKPNLYRCVIDFEVYF